MKMALQGNILKIIDLDNVQFQVIKSWNKMKWNRNLKQLEGIADMELLDKLASICRLPSHIEAYRQQQHEVQNAVNAQRIDPDPKPLVKYPVKISLYKHQIRGANMAMLTFGFVPPRKENTQ